MSPAATQAQVVISTGMQKLDSSLDMAGVKTLFAREAAMPAAVKVNGMKRGHQKAAG